LARIENNRAIRSGEEASEREQDEDEEEEEDEEEKEEAGEEGEEEEASTASARLTEAVSLRFIAALDHERRKTFQGRPVLRSSLSLRVPRSGPSPRPLALFFSLLPLFLNEHLLLGKTVWQPAGERALDLTPRLVKQHFHAAERQFNSLVSLFLANRHPPSPPPFDLPVRVIPFVPPNTLAPVKRLSSSSPFGSSRTRATGIINLGGTM